MLDTSTIDESEYSDSVIMSFIGQIGTKNVHRAAYISLSRLVPTSNRQLRLEMARDGFDRLSQDGDGYLFELPNRDILFFYDAAAGRRVKSEIARLDNDFASAIPALGDEQSLTLGRIYDLSRELGDIIEMVRCHMCDTCDDHCASSDNDNLIKQALKQRKQSKRPVPAYIIPKIHDSLARMDISNFVRLQSIYRLRGRAAPDHAFTDISISLSSISEAVVAGFDIEADPSIAQYMRKTLDKRILMTLLKGDIQYSGKHVAIPLSVASIKSDAFRYFDDAIPISSRGCIIIKLTLSDVMYDADASRFLFSLARHRGYRILIDGVPIPHLADINFALCGVNYIYSDVNSSNLLTAAGVRQLCEARQHAAPAQLILTGIESNEMLVPGVESGIELFRSKSFERIYQDRQYIS